jgi:hypothetical protein
MSTHRLAGLKRTVLDPNQNGAFQLGLWGQYGRSRLRALLQNSAPHPGSPTPRSRRLSPTGKHAKPPTHRRSWKAPHPSAHRETTHPPTGTSGKSVDPDSSAKHERGEIDGAPPTGAPRTDPPAVAVRFFGLTHRHR